MSWNSLNDEDKRAIEEKFIGLSAADAIRRHLLESDRPKSYGFGDVMLFATDATYDMTSGLQAALKENGKLQAALDQLLSSRVIYQFPRAAAASSGHLDSREGDGFSILIKPSRAQNGQVYVIVKMEESFDEEPKMLMTKNTDGNFYKHSLPLSVEGVFQFLAKDDDDLIKSLRDAAAEVYLN